MAIGTPVGLGSGSNSTIGGTTVALTLGTAIVAGDLVVVAIGSDHNPGSDGVVSSVTDGTNTYVLSGTAKGTSAQADVELWYCANCAAVASGSITATFGAAIQSGRSKMIAAARVTGVAIASALDKSANSTASGTSPTVSTGTLAQAAEIVFSVDFTLSTTSSYTVSTSDAFTSLYYFQTATDSLGFVYKTVSATTSITNNPTWGGNGGTQVPQAIASFKQGSLVLTLTAAQGTFTLTGIAATLVKTKPLICAAGSYLLTGVAAHFPNFFLRCTNGVYLLSGQTVLVKRGYNMAMATGTYALTGVAASLKKALRMALAAGSYLVTGIPLVVAEIVAPLNKFKLRLANFRLQKLRVDPPNLDD